MCSATNLSSSGCRSRTAWRSSSRIRYIYIQPACGYFRFYYIHDHYDGIGENCITCSMGFGSNVSVFSMSSQLHGQILHCIAEGALGQYIASRSIYLKYCLCSCQCVRLDVNMRWPRLRERKLLTNRISLVLAFGLHFSSWLRYALIVPVHLGRHSMDLIWSFDLEKSQLS